MNKPVGFLTAQAQGDDVSRLQGGLLELGWSIAPDELTGAFFGTTTRMAVAEFQRQRDLPVTGSVDDIADRLMRQELAARPRRRRVLGVVRNPNGRPGSGLTVRAFDRDLRHEQPLGEAETDGQGFYELIYSHEQFARAEKGAADLILRVYRGTKALHDPSPDATLFNAPDMAVINIELAEGDTQAPSEFERLLGAVTPLLDGVALDGLQEDDQSRDITFLAGETGFPGFKLAHFAVAQKLASAYKIVPEFFYALFAENTLLKAGHDGAVGVRFEINLGTELLPLFYDVVLLPAETVRAAVRQAVKDKFVSRDLTRQLGPILEHLARRLPEARAYLTEQRPKILLRHVERFLSAGKHEEVRRILEQDTLGDLPGLFARLQEAAAFTDGNQAAQAATEAALGDLLGNDDRILGGVRESQGIERPEDLVRLARLDRAGWSEALRTAAQPAGETSEPGKATEAREARDDRHARSPMPGDHPMREELIDLHASALVRKMEKRFPTPAFAAQLERDGAAFGPHRKELLALFVSHPDLDLAHINIDRLLKEQLTGAATESPTAAGTARAGNGRAPQNTGSVGETLKSIQRVFKVAPRYRPTAALLERGIHSAAAIHAMGETRFVREFAKEGLFTPEEAHAAFHKASDIHTASALLAGELQAATGAAKVSALMKGEPADKLARLEAVTRDFPNFKSLFQLDDYCACEECRSVHSAAAYVADTLQFLKNRQVVDTTASPAVSVEIAKDVLFERRPDLGDTDLNCDNTNTPVPYIDVVCELLEEAVAPDPGFAFNGLLASGAVTPALLTALQAQGLPFTAQAIIFDADLSGSRIVRDKAVVCKLTPAGGGNWVIRRLRQTHGTPAERAAAPEYLNDAAYTTLATSEFAFRLPFDLFHQETRAYFARFDVSRAELMRALRIPAGPQESKIAAEELGLSDEERKLIGTADPANQNTYWNTGATPAADLIKVVDAFVTRTELTYADLEGLLDRPWINPNKALFVRHLDNTCSLAQKEIRNLDAPALDRFHRFIRLWKKTGWTTTAIDRMIRAPKLGNGLLDDACLVRMQQMARLSGKLGLPLDETCNLYDVIPADGDASRYARLFLNLAANGTIEEDFRPETVHQNELDEGMVPGSGKKLAAYKSYLALCLGAKLADGDLLVDSLGAAAILSAANIAAVYALNLLARKLRLSAAELLILRGLTGIDILASPADTLHFIEKAEKVRGAGVKPADLRYLLTHQADNLNDRIFRDDAIAAFLTGLQNGYQTLCAETRSSFNPLAPADENKNGLRTLLAKLPGFSEADLSRFQTLLDDTFQDPILTPANYSR